VGAVTSPLILADYTSTAIQYFTSTRIPAALIAGSSLAALFSLADQVRLGPPGARTRLEGATLLVYHVLALTSLLLSLNVIVIATASSNYLLLGSEKLNPLAVSAYQFLKREMVYEFAMARWSFYTGLFSFLGCISTRALLEFDLLRKERIRSALLVLFAMSSLFFHLFAFCNQRLVCWPNLAIMTVGVGRMFVKKALTERNPAELISLASMAGTAVTLLSLVWQSATFRVATTATAGDIADAGPTDEVPVDAAAP
jgi:hypothetical protein